MVDSLSGHTAAGNTLGGDGLRDGDALSSPTITNILQGLRGNGIIRLEDSAYGSTRNAVNSQPGGIMRASTHTLTVSGGYVILDGQLYEFAGGPGGTATVTLGTDGTGTALAASGEQSLYVLYLAAQGGQGQVHVNGGTPVKISTGLYPSIPSQYLSNYDTGTTRDNQQVVVLATVRCEYNASGGNHKVNILEVNDKRHFLRNNPLYMFPLSSGNIVTDGTELSQISRGAAEGVQSPSDLRGLFSSESGKIGKTANGSTLIDAGALWMSSGRSGAGIAASATVTISDYSELNNGDSVALVDTVGTTHTFTVAGSGGGSNWVAETDNNTTASNLRVAVNANAKFSANVSSNVVTITQSVAGVDGNTTITLTDSGTAGMSKSDFSNGISYGFGPGDGLDRDSNRMADSLLFAGQENSQTELVSRRLFGRGVAAPSSAISTTAVYTISSYGDEVYILNPASGVTVTLNPEKSGSKYLFSEGHTIEVVNSASSGGGNLVFDSTGLNSTVAAEYRATFIYEGSEWLWTAHETSSSSAATNFLALTDTPSAFSGQAGKGVKVNSGENSLEFYTLPTAPSLFPGIDDQTSTNDDQLTITDSAIILNEDSDDIDFRVESNSNTHMLFVDGGNNRVSINQSSPDAVFQIEEVGYGYETASIISGSNNGSTAITLDLFDTTKFRATKVIIEVVGEDGAGNPIYEVAEVLLVHTGTSGSTPANDTPIPMTIYGHTQSDSTDTNSGTDQATYDAAIVGGKVQLQVTPAISSIAVTVKAYWKAITI